MGIRRLAIEGAQGCEVRLEDQAIVKFNVADPERAEQHRILSALPCEGCDSSFMRRLPSGLVI